MRADKEQFPRYFPPDCPPDDAEIIDKEMFRFCTGTTITKHDFISLKVMNRMKKRTHEEEIRSYGLSMSGGTLEHTKGILAMPRMRNRGFKSIAVGNIKNGVTLSTPSNANSQHYTWWPFKFYKAWEEFTICFIL